jgi:hypothetical protein
MLALAPVAAFRVCRFGLKLRVVGPIGIGQLWSRGDARAANFGSPTARKPLNLLPNRCHWLPKSEEGDSELPAGRLT